MLTESFMQLLEQTERSRARYNLAQRQALATATGSPEHQHAQQRGNAALAQMETAIRVWVAANPADSDSTEQQLTATCTVCGQQATWTDCPTGGWWTHDAHPADGHDAQADEADLRAEITQLRTKLADEKALHVTDLENFKGYSEHTAKTISEVRAQNQQLDADLNGAYRERAHLLADIAARHPSHLAYSDSDVPTWPVLTIEPDTGQMCWHINPDDLDLFEHVTWGDAFAIGWDGHTTEEKYQRLRALTAAASGAEPGPAVDRCKDCGTPRKNGRILHTNHCLPC